MSMLRKEWTEEEIAKLDYDLKAAKIKVFKEWGFSDVEIGKIADLPVSIVKIMLS